MSEAASTSLSHGKAKIDAMSICMNNMPSSYAMPIFHLQGIPVSFLRWVFLRFIRWLMTDDCWCWLRHGYKKCVSGYANPSADIHGNQMTAQFFFIGQSSTVGISTGQWTALWCSNMKKIVWLFHVLVSWINVGGGMRFDSWCWSAHFHLGINGNTTRISSFKCKSIYT